MNQNTTPITNRLELSAHRSPNITRNNTSKLLQVTTKLSLATLITYSKQDTHLVQQGQLSKQDKHETHESPKKSNSQLLERNKHEKQELNMGAARNKTEHSKR